MSPLLSYIVAQQKTGDLIRSAERARIARAGTPGESRAHRLGWIARVQTRLRIAPSGGGHCAEDPAR